VSACAAACLHVSCCALLPQARTSKLGQDDFLRLLTVFNKEGIHFS
jgi:hypothetical protein